MPRPCCPRRIDSWPPIAIFKPAGVPARLIEWVELGLDEFEALRLADLLGLYQEEAAARMGVSRPTFTRIIERARRKVADALVHGKALVFQGQEPPNSGGAIGDEFEAKGMETMPNQDGTGLRSAGKGLGMGPCGGGRRRGWMGGRAMNGDQAQDRGQGKGQGQGRCGIRGSASQGQNCGRNGNRARGGSGMEAQAASESSASARPASSDTPDSAVMPDSAADNSQA